jgi:hypothetical protein
MIVVCAPQSTKILSGTPFTLDSTYSISTLRQESVGETKPSRSTLVEQLRVANQRVDSPREGLGHVLVREVPVRSDVVTRDHRLEEPLRLHVHGVHRQAAAHLTTRGKSGCVEGFESQSSSEMPFAALVCTRAHTRAVHSGIHASPAPPLLGAQPQASGRQGSGAT